MLNKFFVAYKSKYMKKYNILGIKLRVYNYLYMIRFIYKFVCYQRVKESCENRGYKLPIDAFGIEGEFDIIKIPLKCIKREWKGKLYNLEECSPYKFLVTRNEKIYEQYIQKHIDMGVTPKNADKTPARFLELERSINENGYDPSKCIIVLSRDNKIVDGQHRSCILLYKYGPDFEITALREK